jgi:glutamate racemase
VGIQDEGRITSSGVPEIPRGAIGIFDSGVGGLSVWKEVDRLLPQEHIIYIADQKHIPYGPRPLDEVRSFAEGIVRFMERVGVKLVIVACNTASAAALYHLRSIFGMPIVGMEPAVKPAALSTKTGKVGVIATPATFQGEPYARLLARYGQGVEVISRACPGLVGIVERGELLSPATLERLHECLDDMVESGMDQIVLGCTHYPFLREAIERVVGEGVRVIDPAPAVAAQAKRVLEREGILEESADRGARLFFTTASDTSVLSRHLLRLLSVSVPVFGLEWVDGELRLRGGDNAKPSRSKGAKAI